MHVSRSNLLKGFFVCFVPLLGLVLASLAQASIIDPATLTEINRQADSDPISWDDARTFADPYYNDRGELIGVQGNITDAMTGKTMVGLEGLLLSNDAKDTQGNAAGENYEIKFQITPGLAGKARVYVMIGIRDVFNADPEDWLQGRLNDNAYSPRNNITTFPAARTWIGLNVNGVPVGSVFNRVLRRPGPDARPMAFPVRNGVGEEYFAFYHDFNPGEWVGIYGCYSAGSNYQIFFDMAPPDPPAIWTSADIGSTLTGDTQYNAATYTWDIYADGGDIWDSADAFRYVYTQASGDFMIQGRMAGFSWANNDWGKAGFMMRESTAANSVHGSIFVRAPNDFLGIQYRGATGSGSGGGTESWFSPVLPRWLRWQRAGSVLTASTSNDAVTWTQFGQLGPVPTGPVLVGMAVTSHNTATIAGATFQRVYVTGQVFAHAGLDQSADQGAGQSFVLDPTSSVEATEYLWEQIAGAPVLAINATASTPQTIDTTTFNVFGDQTFVFRLTVKNATGVTQTDTVSIFVKDKEQANAGPDQTVGEGVKVTLDGSASTGVITTWAWVQTAGPDVGPWFGETGPNPFFFSGDYANDQTLEFKVTINGGEDTDFVKVFPIDAQRALANAGLDKEGFEMRTISLDATGTTTRNGVPYTGLTYAWQQTAGPTIYKFLNTNTPTPTFIAPEIPLTKWPPTRTLTFRVTTTGPNGSTDQDTVNVLIKDAEFETVYYREHEDFDFHGSPDGAGRWYPTEAVFGGRYAGGKVANEVSGMAGRLNPTADYWWNGSGGDGSYRPGVSLGNDAAVANTCGTPWKSGWINPGAGDYWKYTFELPHGSAKAYIVNWLGTDNGWGGNSRAYYDLEQGNTSPVGVFRVARRGWDDMAPHISPPFQVNAGVHKILIDAYGNGEPNYSRWEFHVPMPDKNTANAGADTGAVSGELVTLDGRGSQALDTAYTWEQVSPDAPAVTLADAGGGVATFTAPTVATATNFIFRLTIAGATNDSVDFINVMVIPTGLGFSLFADQRTARDGNLVTDWGNRGVGGAELGSAYEAGNWGALPAERRLSSNLIVHHNQFTTTVEDPPGYVRGVINNDCYSEFAFTLPAGSAGDYRFYLRAAYVNGDSAYIRCNEGVMGIWPTANPGRDHYLIANDNGYRGNMDWNWAALQANTVTLKDGLNEIRIYGAESHCSDGRPFIWDAMIFSKVDLSSIRNAANFDVMDAVARAAQTIATTLLANAGPDFSVYAGQTGVLDGTDSLGATSYAWTQTAGPAVTINNAGSALANFTAPAVVAPTTLTFKLTVGDGTNTATDTVNALVLKAGAAPPPTGLTAEGIELGIKLGWTASPGAATYTILRREVGVPWPFDTLVAEGVAGTSFLDTSMTLFMDQVYSYTVIAVNAFGESAPAIPVQAYALSANLAMRADAGPFAKKPHPGWTLGTLMNNRVKEETFDSWYYSEASADDWWGYFWPQKMYFQEIHYYPGNVFGDGGWWTSLGVQFTKNGVSWYNIPGVTITPPYQFSPDTPDGRSPATGQLPFIRRHILKFPKVEGIAVRIYGAPGGSVDFTSMAELEVYGVPGPEGYLYSYAGADFSADEGTVATLDGSDSSTPLAVSFLWEQITGAGGAVTQVNMSSAFNRDVIYADGEDLAAQDAYEPGGDNWLYSSRTDIAPAGSNPLPANGVVGPFQLGPGTGRNCLLLSDAQRNGTVPITPGNYGYLDVVFSGASGNHWTQMYLNYANGDSPVIWFEFSDWFFRGDVERAWQNSFRVSRTSGGTGWADGNPGGPNLYRRRIPVDSDRTLVGVSFVGFPGNGAQTGGVFAMNLGPGIPVLQLQNANTSVCTFTVPDITSDQVITFRLTVRDVTNNTATDEVDVHLVDVQKSVSSAGADGMVAPFYDFVLDGSGTTGNIIWYKWEQIGGPPAVTLFNADQAQATIIVPESGSTMVFKLTTAAANGTVSSDTVTVRSAYGIPAGLPAVPSSGFIQDVLVLGANYSSRFTSNLDVNYDHLAANGGQTNQRPSAGETVNIGGESFVDGPAVWTAMHRNGDVGGVPGGAWFASEWGWPLGVDNFIAYFHVYIISPNQRDARAILRHDDEMRCWNNGALSFGRDGWDGGGQVASDFTLFEGVNSMTFKLHEGGGGNYLAVRFTDRSDNQYGDLRYAYSYRDLLPQVLAIAEPDPYIGTTIPEGEVLYLDGRASTPGVNYAWEQVWPQTPEFAFWFDDTNLPILGAPYVDVDTEFFMRLWADDGTNFGADAVKVTVATKEIPGAVSGITGEWAGDVGAVLRWNAAAHASRYNILRADNAAGPFSQVGTAYTNSFVDTGPLAEGGTYYYKIQPASILNVGPTSGAVAMARNTDLGNVARSAKAVPIVGQPNPLGGGSRDIGIMKDGVVSGQNYDTYDGNTPNPGSLLGEETFEFFGYLFDSAIEVHSLVYYTGGVFGDGGWWTTLGVQVTTDGVTWQDASGFVSGPIYNTRDSGTGRSSYAKYIISIIPDMVTGVRVAGHAGGSARFVSIAELEVYADVGGLNVNAGAGATVNEKTIVTLDGSATTGATTYLWTQIAGPSVVISNANQQVASFTAPGVFFQDSVSFRLTASNAQWSAFDDVGFTVMDVDSRHIFRYMSDFDGHSSTGRLEWADGVWGTGAGFQHDLVQRMRGRTAPDAYRAATADAITGNDFFWQDTSQSYQQYRPVLNPFDVRYLQPAQEIDPFIGYTTVNDWWKYNFGKMSIGKPPPDTSFPVNGVMAITALAATGAGDTVVEVFLDEAPVTTINFTGGNWGDFQWRKGAGTFLVTAGTHSIRLRLAQGGWDVSKFRLDLSQPAIESITKFDNMATLKWNDVGRTYVLQQADTPKGPWTPIFGPTTETSITAPIPPDRMMFYRIAVY
ncbi:MAG: hypothetical protein Q8Q12_08530 [bacterium]|nr:hypothetical protein [bacterium]